MLTRTTPVIAFSTGGRLRRGQTAPELFSLLLTPVYEPSTVVLAAMGFVALLPEAGDGGDAVQPPGC